LGKYFFPVGNFIFSNWGVLLFKSQNGILVVVFFHGKHFRNTILFSNAFKLKKDVKIF